ncbi:MAG: hypothetical protein WBG65_10145, partial [Sulfurimonadaceae bacterium]
MCKRVLCALVFHRQGVYFLITILSTKNFLSITIPSLSQKEKHMANFKALKGEGHWPTLLAAFLYFDFS